MRMPVSRPNLKFKKGAKMQKMCLWAIGLLLTAAVVSSGQVTITDYPTPTGGSAPYGITAGPDGNVWFTEGFGNKIGRITPAGAITEFPITTAASAPYAITTGADGNLWFTENNAIFSNKIGKITPSGVITEFPVTTPGGPIGIAA